MALTQIFTFAIRSGTGAQHVPFPDGSFSAVGGGAVFFSSDKTGTFAEGVFAFGFDDGTHHFGTCVSAGDFGLAFDDPEHGWSDDSSLIAVRTSFAFELKLVGRVTALNVGSLDLQIDINNGVTGAVWTAVVFGNGATFRAGQVLQPSTTPIVLPFAPAMLGGQYHGGASGGTLIGSGGNKVPSFGFAVRCNSVACSLGGAMQGAANPSNTASAQISGNFLTTVSPGSPGTIADTVTITSWDVSGFTPNAPSVGEYFSYFAVGGALGSANAGTFTQAGSPGGQAIAILADQPELVFLASFNKVASGSVQADALISFGAANTSGQQSAIWFGDLDGWPGNAPKCDARQDATALFICATPTAANASTLIGRTALASLASQVINLSWSTTDGTARELVYCALARDPGTGTCGTPIPPNPCGPSAPAIPSNPVSPIGGGGSASGSGGVIV